MFRPNLKHVADAGIHLRFDRIVLAAIEDSHVKRRLCTIGNDRQHIVVFWTHAALADVVCTFDQAANKRFLRRRRRGAHDHRLAAIKFRSHQAWHIFRGHRVPELSRHRGQFRHVLKAGKSRFSAEAASIRCHLYIGDNLSEHRSPGIEVVEIASAQRFRLQILLQHEHLGHRIGQRGCRGEHDAGRPSPHAVDVPNLHHHVDRALRLRSRDSGHALHFCLHREVFVSVSLIDQQHVASQFFEQHVVVLSCHIGQPFEFG